MKRSIGKEQSTRVPQLKSTKFKLKDTLIIMLLRLARSAIKINVLKKCIT